MALAHLRTFFENMALGPLERPLGADSGATNKPDRGPARPSPGEGTGANPLFFGLWEPITVRPALGPDPKGCMPRDPEQSVSVRLQCVLQASGSFGESRM